MSLNPSEANDLTFEQVSNAFENKEALEAMRASLVLKPKNFLQKPEQRVNVKVPRVKLMVLAINNAYPAHRSYI